MLIKKILVPLYFILYKINFLFYKINFLPTYKTKKLYIISVGNLAVGGAGKTPFCIELFSILKNLKPLKVSLLLFDPKTAQ